MSTLENKMVMNIPVDEKEHLDIYKWVWDGDMLEIEDSIKEQPIEPDLKLVKKTSASINSVKTTRLSKRKETEEK
jgi:hypothetical protein